MKKLPIIRTGVVLLCAGLPVLAADQSQPGQSGQSGTYQTPNTQQSSDWSTRSTTGQTMTAERFAREAALSGLKEVRLADIALQKAQNDQVKQLAQTIKQDHTQANQQLIQIAQNKGFSLPPTNTFEMAGTTGTSRTYVREREMETTPTTPAPGERGEGARRLTGRDETGVQSSTPSAWERGAGNISQMKQRDEQTIRRLDSLSGSQFDREYVRYMIQDHQKDIQKFQQASQNIQDPEVKQFAATTLPKLQQHYQQVQQVAQQLGVSTSGQSSQDQPEQQTQPSQPTQPTQPSQPDQPTQPTQPTQPSQPSPGEPK